MLKRKAWWFTYLAYFFAFGSFGGWCLMLAIAATGPGAGVVIVLGMEFFLLTGAMLACLVSFVVLLFRKQPDRLDRGALLACSAYVILHSAFFGWVFLSGASRG